ncbi:hypothetical protein B0T25DRAFT_563047 [Lasiosphaeria hispida]|uniref:Uncharacterized protein n=1 Tax=Lasiosphaeria hispida TaxID=260671 RepID=A0AAJ0HWN1_9PEZI|nr:hypothetical protein B0T25DRAFT_563047 [Lasiosphaeria hispida]
MDSTILPALRNLILSNPFQDLPALRNLQELPPPYQLPTMNRNSDDDIELGFQRDVERDSESANFWTAFTAILASADQRNCLANSFALFLYVISHMVFFIANMIGRFFDRLTLDGESFIPGLALAIKKLLRGLAHAIKKLLRGLAHAIKKLLRGLYKAIRKLLHGLDQDARDLVHGLDRGIRDLFGATRGFLDRGIRDLLHGLTGETRDFVHGLDRGIRDLFGATRGFLDRGIRDLCWAALVLLATFLAIFLIVLYTIAPEDRLQLIKSIFSSAHTDSPM